MKHLLYLACALLLASCSGQTPATGSGDGADAATSSSCATCNKAYRNIMTRTSIRAFTPRAVSRDTVEMLLRAGMAAPTAVDRRPWHFVVLQGPALKAFADSMQYRGQMGSATLAIAVCGNASRYLEGEGRDFWVQDCSAATENVLLAINALGLGGVWTGVYPIAERVAKVSRLLELPDSLTPLDVILCGYPAEQPEPKEKWNPADVTWR